MHLSPHNQNRCIPYARLYKRADMVKSRNAACLLEVDSENHDNAQEQTKTSFSSPIARKLAVLLRRASLR